MKYRIVLLAGVIAASSDVLAQKCDGELIEDITVSSSANIRPSTVASYLEIYPGQCISADQLDAALIQGQSRLRALGVYKTVEFALKKGSERNRFIIEATLEPHSAYYVGGLTNFGWSESKPFEPVFFSEHQRIQTYGAYVGSRSVLETDWRADLEYNYSAVQRREKYEYSYTFNDEEVGGSSSSKHDEERHDVYFNLFHPGMFEDSIVAGATYVRRGMISHSTTRSESITVHDTGEISSEPETYKDHYSYADQSFTGKLGLRFQQISALVFLTRGVSKYDDDASSSADFNTYFGPQVSATNKTHLSVMEPGYYLKLSYTQKAAPKWDQRYWALNAEYTYFPISILAVTPIGQMVWDTTDRHLFRFYQFGLRHQVAWSKSFIIAAEGTGLNFIGDYGFFRRNASLKFSYVRPTFSYDLILQLGEPFNYFDVDKRRVSE